jgi:hypothetical protein
LFARFRRRYDARHPGGALERLRRFYDELRRRRMFRALGAYAVGAFAVLQVAEPIVNGLHLPGWSISAVVIACAAGFPVAFALSWAFDFTSRGIERTPDLVVTPAPPTPPAASPAVKPGPMSALLEELAWCTRRATAASAGWSR